jgi:hypothetical protein
MTMQRISDPLMSIAKLNSKDPGPEDPALVSPQRGGVYLKLRVEEWNGGRMEYWESKAEDGLIL